MTTVPLTAIVREYVDRKMKSEIATDWGSVVFYRWPAFALAWGLIPLGVTPNQVTALGALLVPAMALMAWLLPPQQAVVVVTLLAIAFNVLDCTDGVLARALNRGSVTGRYMDFATDIAFRVTAYGCYGLIADRLWPGAVVPWLAVGLCCGLLALYARVNRLFADELFAGEGRGEGDKPGWFGIAFSLLSGLDTLLPLIAFLAFEAGLLRVAMMWFLLYTAGDSVIEVIENVARARQADRRAVDPSKPARERR